MSERTKLLIVVTVSNVAIIGLFILLAITFKHWWIALFSGLFTLEVKNKCIKED